MLLKDLDEVESESYGGLPRSLDLHTFGHLVRQVTYWALKKIAEDWEECKQTVSRSTAEGIANEDCECELLLHYSLPCKALPPPHSYRENTTSSLTVPSSLVARPSSYLEDRHSVKVTLRHIWHLHLHFAASE
jgi:hypothetical protein